MDKRYIVIYNRIYYFEFDDRFEALDFAEMLVQHQTDNNNVDLRFKRIETEATDEARD